MCKIRDVTDLMETVNTWGLSNKIMVTFSYVANSEHLTVRMYKDDVTTTGYIHIPDWLEAVEPYSYVANLMSAVYNQELMRREVVKETNVV